MTLPLYAGIRIIDLSMGWAGPLACRHMADLGADVIKVESCKSDSTGGAAGRQRPNGSPTTARKNLWPSTWSTATSARSRSTWNTAEGSATCCWSWSVQPNAVVENFSGGVMDKLGLSFDDLLRGAKPDIILVSMPAFGSTGPWRGFRAYGSTVEQASGLPHLNGNPEATRPPCNTSLWAMRWVD